MEMIVMIMFCTLVKQCRLRVCRHCIDRICARLVECNRVERCEHTDIGYDRHIIFCMAIAVGRNVQNQRDMEARTAINDRFGVLGNLAVEHDIGLIVIARDGIFQEQVVSSLTAGAVKE